MPEYTYESKSSPGTTYTAHWDEEGDGKLRCDCRGWTAKRPNQPRHCTHTKQIAFGVRLTHKLDERGDYVHLVPKREGEKPGRRAPAASPAASPPPAAPAPVPPRTAYAPHPMLASPMDPPVTGDAFTARFGNPDQWVLEEKLDGHRVVVAIDEDGDGRTIIGYSRPRAGEAPKVRVLPRQVLHALTMFPAGVYDGELVVPGGKASDVVRKGAAVTFAIYDLLAANGHTWTGQPYHVRREGLLHIRRALDLPQEPTAPVWVVPAVRATWQTVEAIWAAGGEGAILKRRDSIYRPGARSDQWLKVKQEVSAVITITGYDEGKAGAYAVVVGRTDDGTEVRVKTLDNDTLRAISRAPDSFIGRRLAISAQERLASGSYRHPMWDHWADADRALDGTPEPDESKVAKMVAKVSPPPAPVAAATKTKPAKAKTKPKALAFEED